ELTGSIDLTVADGTGPYTFLWDNAETTEDIDTLAAGTYSVTVTDANGCEFLTSKTVSQPLAALTASTTKIDVKCFGDLTGSIDLTATGGTSPYTFLWDNAETTEDIDTLASGTYSVTVTDDVGCEFLTSETVSQPLAALTASTTKIDVKCYGESSGSIDLTVAGGTGPFTFLWDNAETTEDIDTLAIGSYNVTVTDANGCEAFASETLTQPTEILIAMSSTPANCGNNDGTATAVASQGTSPYDFEWSDPGSQTTSTATSLFAGLYTVTVTDFIGCVKTNNTIVANNTDLTATISDVIHVTCNGLTNGSAIVTPALGTPPYTYVWSSGGTDSLETNLGAGTHLVTVYDAATCQFAVTVDINQPLPLSTNAIPTNISCYGGSDGAIDLSVSGGTSPYLFDWSNMETTEDIDSLGVAMYYVTVTDSNLCVITDSAEITQPAVLSSSVSPTHLLCYNDNSGLADLTVSGGTGPYNFLWSNTDIDEDIDSLPAGTYYVTITDAGLCEATDSVEITQPDLLTTSLAVVDVACNGGTNGAINLTVSGGTSPYTFAWDGGETTEDIDSLSAGMYYVMVTDTNLCSAVDSAEIVQPDAILTSFVASAVSCDGGSNGAVDLTVSGGTGSYAFAWSNSATSEDIDSLIAGIYTVTVTDTNLCTIVDSIEVVQPLAVTTLIIPSDALCYGESDGAADLTVSGGTSPYTFLWDNADTTEDLTAVAAGTYYVVVTDTNGCEATDSVVIGQPAEIQLAMSSTDANCGSSDGTATAIPSDGVSPYIYLWNDSTAQTTQTATNLFAGSYTVTVTDSIGCIASQSIVVGNNTTLTGYISEATDVACNGYSDGSATVHADLGTPPYTYAWSGGGSDSVATGLSAGTYYVTVYDAALCQSLHSVTIEQPDSIILVLSSTDDNGTGNGTATVIASGGTPPFTYLWDDSLAQTTSTATDLIAGEYLVIVTDSNGCVADDTISVVLFVQVAEHLAKFGISVFPNPVVENLEVVVSAETAGKTQLSVLDVNGQVVYRDNRDLAVGNNHFTVDMSKFAAGVYFIQVGIGQKSHNFKVIKPN
ncbi:MAG: T9SS type A sorting domain-containing protein, partial [Bacteroidetes bacterium]|nr:T9SS type A sorting domain-containing protein [Bacteroidota bacterium]